MSRGIIRKSPLYEQSREITLESAASIIKPGSTFTEPSEAVKSFTHDFEMMRRKQVEMQFNMKTYSENMKEMMDEMRILKNENLKLNSDIKIIRNEHQEMAHSIYSLETKNQDL